MAAEGAVVEAAGLLKLNDTLFVLFAPDRAVKPAPNVSPVADEDDGAAGATFAVFTGKVAVGKNESPDVAVVVGAAVGVAATNAPKVGAGVLAAGFCIGVL